ncbi:MAG: FISUMP domain-containing protein, partial [Patescibacteria group bacterium]
MNNKLISKTKKGFTLVELIIVLAIIGIVLATAFISFSNARQKARDAKRVSDITQVQNTLELYFRDEGRYPASLTFGSELVGSSSNRVYMVKLPENPTPRNDNTCPDNEYSYLATNNGESYELNFCVSETTGNFASGEKCATSQGILNQTCPTEALVIETYTLAYTAGANGSLTGATPQTVNGGENGTEITAVADSGYHFVDWSDASTSNPRTDTSVSGTVSVTANFAINQYTLTYAAGSNGSITGSSPQTVNYGDSGSAVTAVANTGYHFVNWSDASTSNPRTDTNVSGNVSVTANFEADVFICGTNQVAMNNIGSYTCNESAPYYDKCTYDTVNINGQCWLKQNLNIGNIITGATGQNNNSILEKYCYNNTYSNCQSDGALYQWDEAMQYTEASGAQGICPTGWHIPTDAEQNALDQYLYDPPNTCNASRIDFDCANASPKLRVGGSSNFQGILTGYLYTDLLFYENGTATFWWSSSINI